MPLNKRVVLLIILVLVGSSLRSQIPIIGEARSVRILPSFFILEDRDHLGARAPDWVKLVTAQYYVEAIQALKSDIAERKTKGYASEQTEKVLASLEADAARGLIPRWAENIFVVCRESEVIVSFFTRNGGWSTTTHGTLVTLPFPAYVCTIDPKANVVRSTRDLKAAVFVDLYKHMGESRVVTDYSGKIDAAAPLNGSNQPNGSGIKQ